MKMKIIVLAMLVATTPHTRATIHRAFRPDDFEILWTANPSEAAEASARHRPDLLLLDLNQPLHKGWKTLEGLRRANPGAPAVVLAEHESIYDQAVANRKGAVLQKPVGVAALLETVNTLIKRPAAFPLPEQKQSSELNEAILKSEQFRAELLERYNAPYALPDRYRHWGINE